MKQIEFKEIDTMAIDKDDQIIYLSGTNEDDKIVMVTMPILDVLKWIDKDAIAEMKEIMINYLKEL